MLFLTKSANALILTHPRDRDSVSVELKEKRKYICSRITQYVSVNDNLTLRVFLGYPGFLSYQSIAISMIMSMAIILQILLSYVVICINCTLKLKRQTDLRQSPYMAPLFRQQDT